MLGREESFPKPPLDTHYSKIKFCIASAFLNSFNFSSGIISQATVTIVYYNPKGTMGSTASTKTRYYPHNLHGTGEMGIGIKMADRRKMVKKFHRAPLPAMALCRASF